MSLEFFSWLCRTAAPPHPSQICLATPPRSHGTGAVRTRSFTVSAAASLCGVCSCPTTLPRTSPLPPSSLRPRRAHSLLLPPPPAPTPGRQTRSQAWSRLHKVPIPVAMSPSATTSTMLMTMPWSPSKPTPVTRPRPRARTNSLRLPHRRRRQCPAGGAP